MNYDAQSGLPCFGLCRAFVLNQMWWAIHECYVNDINSDKVSGLVNGMPLLDYPLY